MASLDIRLPIGGLFALIGAILGAYGAIVHPQTTVGINIDLWWGAAMLVFGLALFAFGWSAGHREREHDV
jgi:sulfite exporter TauE/SafE